MKSEGWRAPNGPVLMAHMILILLIRFSLAWQELPICGLTWSDRLRKYPEEMQVCL